MAQAKALGYSALAITDECSLAGIVRAHVAAKQIGLKLIVGTELRLADATKLVLLAQNRAGYGNLSTLITLARRRADKDTLPPEQGRSGTGYSGLSRALDCPRRRHTGTRVLVADPPLP